MKRSVLFLMLLSTVCLFGQTGYQVQYVNTVHPTNSFVCSAVQSDGALFMFGISAGDSAITITRTICSEEGVIGPTEGIITYTNDTPWGLNIPTRFSIENRSFYTFIILKNSSNIYIFRIPDIAINTLPTVHCFVNCGISHYFEPDYKTYAILGTNKLYYQGLDDELVHILNMSTNSQTATQYMSWITPLGNDYLLLFWRNNSTIYKQILNAEGSATDVTFTGDPVDLIYSTSDEIGDGIYIADWVTGFDFTCYGYLVIQNNVVNAHCVYQTMGIAMPYPMDVVPIAYQRFLCREPNYMFTDCAFHTYEIVDGDYSEYIGFPNLNQVELASNAMRLYKVDERFAVATSFNPASYRIFHCIDLQNETWRTSTYPFTIGTSESDYQVSYGFGNIYYTRNGEIIIYKIAQPTENQDYTEIPNNLLSVSPNPFSGSAKINLPKNSSNHAGLQVFNQKGQLVRTINTNNKKGSEQAVEWNGDDNNGRQVKAGIYFLRYSDDKRRIVQKLVKF